MPVGVQCPISSSLGEFPSYWDWLWCPGLSPVFVSIPLPFAFHTWCFPFALIYHWYSYILVFIPKVFEKLALTRPRPHLHGSSNFSSYQSAYRSGHSTETATLKVADNLNSNMDNKSCSLLLSLDISAAFDMLDIDTLLSRLHLDFGIRGVASAWLRSYLTDRLCYVAVGNSRSDTWICHEGVPQGSVLGLLLFSSYVSPIARIFDRFDISYHQYADNTQLYTAVRSSEDTSRLLMCVKEGTRWFLVNELLLNASKTEAIAFGERQQQCRHPNGYKTLNLF